MSATETREKPDLWTALSKAILDAAAIDRSSLADSGGPRFHYASSEDVLTECRAALASNGLALVPESCDVDLGESTDPWGPHGTLRRRWLLVHSTGQTHSWQGPPWPIAPHKGFPYEKALPAALTSSLSYTLRDLLLLPRAPSSEEARGENGGGRQGNARRGPSPQEIEQAERLRAQLEEDILRLPVGFQGQARKDLARAGQELRSLRMVRGRVDSTLAEFKPREEGQAAAKAAAKGESEAEAPQDRKEAFGEVDPATGEILPPEATELREQVRFGIALLPEDERGRAQEALYKASGDLRRLEELHQGISRRLDDLEGDREEAEHA